MKSSNTTLLAAIFFAGLAMADPALAQVGGGDPLAGATAGAQTLQRSLASFGLIVGGIGMVACLMLGFFGKLNWKWVATGVGVSFAMAIVPGAIQWLSTLAGGA
jgi:hypothetical protein